MINKIIFKGYKSFKELNELELKPMTVIFGKNSSGKSAIVKLPTLIEGAISTLNKRPFNYINKNIELGAEPRDLFYQKEFQANMNLEIFDGENRLSTQIMNSTSGPIIVNWETSVEGIEKIDQDNIRNKDFRGLFPVKNKELLISIFQLKTDYIGPFRIIPPRNFYLRNNEGINDLGIIGERAYELLASDDDLQQKVNKWYDDNLDGWKLFIKKNEPYYEIRFTQKPSDNEGINIRDVGQGMSQVLPIVVNAFREDEEPILKIIEQPELHLHPGAHGNLAELLINSSKKNESKYLIETHSKNFILRLRRLIAERKIKSEDVNLYYVDYSQEEDFSSLKKINILSNGEVDEWPSNVFEESFEEVKALMKAQRDIE